MFEQREMWQRTSKWTPIQEAEPELALTVVSLGSLLRHRAQEPFLHRVPMGNPAVGQVL